MKNLIVIVLCSVVGYSYAALTAEQGAKLGAWQEECFKKTGVSTEALMGAIGAGGPIVGDARTHIMCLAITAKLLEPDESCNEAKLKAELLLFDNNPDKVNGVMAKCKNPDSLLLVTCIFTSFTA